jgi:uncharacterized RDD family membrane protein YckC
MNRRTVNRMWSLRLAHVALLALAGGAEAADERLITAGHQDHLWFVIPSDTKPGEADLCHHAADMGGPYFRVQMRLSQRPVAMASWESRVWIVFPPRTAASGSRREVFTLEVEKNAAFGTYVAAPAGRLDIAASLPGDGGLEAFVGTQHGPVALIVPEQAAGTTGASGQAGSGVTPLLLQLVNDQWTKIGLPGDASLGPQTLASAGGVSGAELDLFASEPRQAGCVRFSRDRAGDWTSTRLALDLSRVRALVPIGAQTAVVLSDASSGMVELQYVRDDSIVPLTSFPAPLGTWSVVGLRDGFRLLERQTNGIAICRIGSITGDLSEAQAMRSPPLAGGKLWQVSLLVAMSISALLLVFLIKPVSKTPVALPAGVAPVPISLRLVALLVDLLPAGVLAGLMLRAPLGDLIASPLITLDLERSVPYLVMAGLAALHCTVSELVTSASLGKAVVGARVTDATGARPKPVQVFLRNGIKFLVLLVPPLAVFALINPHLQGLPDMAAATVVVREVPGGSDAQPQDR